MISIYGFTDSQIVNMDETAIYLDAPCQQFTDQIFIYKPHDLNSIKLLAAYTYSPIGAKRIKAVTAGNERTRISVAFSAIADGTKLPMFAIIPRKTPIESISQLSLVETEYKKSSTFDEITIISYVNEFWFHKNSERIWISFFS